MPGVPPPNDDLAELASILGDDNVRVLIRTFLREYPTLLSQLETGDRKTQHRIAHSLKSSARVVGARELSARMAAIEARLGPENGPVLAAAEVADIAAAFNASAKVLQAFADGK